MHVHGCRMAQSTAWRRVPSPTLFRCVVEVRYYDAGLFSDQAVMFDAAVSGEIEHQLLAETAFIEIAVGDQQLVLKRFRLRDDLSARVDDNAGAD